jgi:hypothetical protein
MIRAVTVPASGISARSLAARTYAPLFHEVLTSDIERHYGPGHGRHWFDRNSTRFFGTRLAELAYQTFDGTAAFFVTSEQPPHGRRAYSVRRYDFATRDISTVGRFCGYASRNGAHAAARRHASQHISQTDKAA